MKRRCFLCAILSFMATHAFGRDPDGRYAQSPLREWFNSLASKRGNNCCSFADGLRVDDVDWRRTDDADKPYEVMLDGEWREVPWETVVEASNKVGYAIVWPVYFYGTDGKQHFSHIRCFLPGTEI